MSVTKQFSSLCPLYSFHEKIPEEYLNETFFNTTFLTLLSPRFDLFEWEKAPKVSSTKMVNVCQLKTQQSYVLQVERKTCKNEISCSLDSSYIFLKPFDQASKNSRIILPKAENANGSTKSGDNLFFQYSIIILHH